jgi:hypothetical protein
MMTLTVHNLAKEYGMLPSQALANATTFDLHVLDMSSRWIKYQQEQQEQKHGNKTAPAIPKLTVEQMQAMMARVRNQERK